MAAGFRAQAWQLAHGPAASRYTLQAAALAVAATLRNAAHIQDLRADLVMVDQFFWPGSSVAEHFALPFITLCASHTMIRESTIPPSWMSWPCGVRLSAPRTAGLLPLRRSFSQPSRAAAGSFPIEQLNGKPLIYASMGTLQNRLAWVFAEIARASMGLDAQLVISLGGGKDPAQIGPLPGNPLVVRYAPQLGLLARAALTITHPGLNTALESLSCGVPMVAIPVGNDQPAVAARVRWTGAGEMLPLERLRANRLTPLVERVLTQESYPHRNCRGSGGTEHYVQWQADQAGDLALRQAAVWLAQNSENRLGQHRMHTLGAIHYLSDVQIHRGAREHVGIIPGQAALRR